MRQHLVRLTGWLLFCLLAVPSCIPTEKVSFFAAQFSGKTGWLIGSESYATYDGGVSWNKLELPVDLSLYFRVYLRTLENTVQLLDDQVGFISGWNGNQGLWKTEDGGDTWARLMAATPQNIFFRDTQFGISGSRFTGTEIQEESMGSFRTIDGGHTWEKIRFFPLDEVKYLEDTIFAVEALWSVIMSTDEGETWSKIAEFPDDIINRLTSDGRRLWITGSHGLCAEYDLVS